MPHPCETTPDIPECIELAQKLAPDASTLDALASNAPVLMERLDAAIAHVGTWVESGEAFATEQVPLLVNEIIYWAIARASFWMLFGLFFVFVGWMTYRIARKHWSEWTKSRDELHGFLMAVTSIVSVAGPFIGFIVVTTHLLEVIKPIVAPRLYLIEYFRRLVQ